MRRLLDTIYILAAAMLIVSCNADMEDIGRTVFYRELGVITYVDGSNYFEITNDDGIVYIVAGDNLPDYGVAEGKRLYFSYYDCVSVTGDPNIRPELQVKDSVLAIQLERPEYVLTKPLIKESFILENEKKRRDSIGYDGIRPFKPHEAWFGGDFLNVNFEYLRFKDSQKRHMINLVLDDVRKPESEDDDYVYLYLRHNAYGESPSASVMPQSDTGICSFDLSGIIPKGKSSVKVKLFWDWYQSPSAETVEYSKDMGEFVPGYNGLGRSTDTDGPYYISPPANPTAFVL